MWHQYLERGARPRHRHKIGYAAFILSGKYEEIGDAGHWQVQEGDVVYHSAFEAHRNFIGSECAIINIDVPQHLSLPAVFKINRPDELLKAAANDGEAIARHLIPSEIKQQLITDWPDLLAHDLLNAPIHLGDWAEKAGLRLETVSRGFRRVYGTTPARYRREAQTRSALRIILNGHESLADIAYLTGFSDQAHMSRAVTALTGRTPGKWRKIKTVQDRLSAA
nr:AraC family transcriptional regulator [Erythrobacter ani]